MAPPTHTVTTRAFRQGSLDRVYYISIYVSSHIKMMHMSDPTCSLFGEVGIMQGMLECQYNFAFFNVYGVQVYKSIPFIVIQVD